jgi:hypothetical protein
MCHTSGRKKHDIYQHSIVLADQKLNSEEIQMQTLTMNEQEMVAGGESWAYEGSAAFAEGDLIGSMAWGAAAGAGSGALMGAGLGMAGGLAPAVIGALGGTLWGAATGAAMVVMSWPVYRGRVTIEELGVGGGGGGGMGGGGLGGGGVSSGGSAGSEMEGSRCF